MNPIELIKAFMVYVEEEIQFQKDLSRLLKERVDRTQKLFDELKKYES